MKNCCVPISPIANTAWHVSFMFVLTAHNYVNKSYIQKIVQEIFHPIAKHNSAALYKVSSSKAAIEELAAQAWARRARPGSRQTFITLFPSCLSSGFGVLCVMLCLTYAHCQALRVAILSGSAWLCLYVPVSASMISFTHLHLLFLHGSLLLLAKLLQVLPLGIFHFFQQLQRYRFLVRQVRRFSCVRLVALNLMASCSNNKNMIAN